MKRYPFFYTLWVAVNLSAALSLGVLVYGGVWEYSTRKYLEGFSDAVVPLSARAEDQVAAILSWMEHGPTRRTAEATGETSARDPHQTLNHAELLRVCGTASNAFINLAASSGLQARRLLLLDEHRDTKHVVAEVFLDGRWVVVDPLYRTMFRDATGKLLSKEMLRNPEVLREATRNLPGYNPLYSYDRTAHVRLRKIPVLGGVLRTTLDAVWPAWEEAVNWSLILERPSFALTLAAGVLFLLSLLTRIGLGRYGEKRLRVSRPRLRDQLLRMYQLLFTNPS